MHNTSLACNKNTKKSFEETEIIEQKKCPEQSKIDITNDKIRVKHMLMLCS